MNIDSVRTSTIARMNIALLTAAIASTPLAIAYSTSEHDSEDSLRQPFGRPLRNTPPGPPKVGKGGKVKRW